MFSIKKSWRRFVFSEYILVVIVNVIIVFMSDTLPSNNKAY